MLMVATKCCCSVGSNSYKNVSMSVRTDYNTHEKKNKFAIIVTLHLEGIFVDGIGNSLFLPLRFAKNNNI